MKKFRRILSALLAVVMVLGTVTAVGAANVSFTDVSGHWAWTGGHSDGEADGLATALKEAREETGIQTLRVLCPQAIALDILEVKRHIKRGGLYKRDQLS